MAWYKEKIRTESQTNYDKLKNLNLNMQSTIWADYVVLDDGTITRLSYLVSLIADAESGVADGDYDDIVDALNALAKEIKPEIELCSNHEWLRVYGGFEPDEDTGNDEIDEIAWGEHESKFRDEFEEFADFDGPGKGRIMCHGWNGADWTHHNRGVGTFDVLTEDGE